MKRSANSNIDLYLLVGRYPQLSETFIIRKAYGLASAGINVTILTRREGDQQILKSFGPPPANLSVKKILPENGPYSLTDYLHIIVLLFKLATVKVRHLSRLLNQLKRSGKRGFGNLIKYGSVVVLKKPDILHFEFSNLAVAYQPLMKIWDCKFIFSTRGADVNLLPVKDEQYQDLFFEVAGAVDRIHAVSQTIKNDLEKRLPAGKVFVNRPATAALLTNTTSPANTIPILVSTGRLEWKKGFDYLLKAYAILKSQGIQFRAFIIGDGSLKNELRFTIDDFDLSDCVELTGKLFHSEVLDILAQADIFVLSSQEEGISNAVLEAMNMSIPVVSTDCGGMAEVINNNENGLLVPLREPYAMAEAVRYLIENPTQRTRKGTAGRETIQDDFTIDRQVKIFEAEYDRLLAI